MKLNRIAPPYFKDGRLKKYYLIMRLTWFLLLIMTLPISASVWSQNTTMSVKLKNSTLQELFLQIEKSSNYRFFYNNDEVDVNQRISISADEMSVGKILTTALEGMPYSFKELENKLIIIEKAQNSKSASEMNAQQQRTISGKIKDTSDVPLPGVSVVVKGTANGSISDGNGNYSISGIPSNAVLVFSFVGMKPQEISIGNKAIINVTLEEENIGLDEVVAIGYGTVKKKDLSGAVGIIKTEQLDQQVNNNLGSAIQGKIAGVTVESAGGAPGSGVTLQIRGAGSLNNNNPLILVDDIPTSSMNSLNPNDIESMQVLKDASAAAIYGSRAANGVILITTKTGKRGPIKIDASFDYGIQSIGKKMDVCNTDQWIKVVTEACNAGGLDVPAIALHPEEAGNGINWQNQIYHTAPIQNYSIGATGGSENLNYNISLSYLDQDGIVKNSDYDRFSLRFKTDFTKGRFKVGESVILSKESTHALTGLGGQGGNAVTESVMMIPAFSIYNSKAIGGYGGESGSVLDVGNPVAALNLLNDKNDWYKALINMYAEVKLIDGLKYKFNVGITGTEYQQESTRQAYDVGTFYHNQYNTNYMQSGLTKYWQLENTLSYVKTFGEKHSINAVIGQTSYDENYSWFSAAKEGMPNGIWSMSAGTTNPASSSSSSENTMTSYLGRVIYSFDNRYIFTGTFRRDGSSRFSQTNRWGNFPSLSAAWNVANESFFKKLETPISEFKLRSSWGQLGNQEIGNYSYTASITPAISYGIGQPNTLWVGNIQTDLVPGKLKWETTTTTNVGMDLGFWNGKLNYSLDWFTKATTDLLLQIPIPLSVGTSSDPYGNAGKVVNNGYEMMLNYNGHHGDFKYSVTGTFSHVKNEVKELSTGSQVLSGSGATHGGPAVTYTKQGYPIYSFFLVQTDGLFRSDAEIKAHSKDGELIQPNAKVGDIRFKDANNDGQIDGSDRVYCGSPFPKYEYGFRLEGSWKFIDASLYFQGTYGNKIYNGFRTYTESAIFTCNYSTDLLNSYSFNKNSDIPRLDMADLNGNGVSNSDRYLEDGSYCRLKSMQIGFTLPESVAKKLSVSKCRFYIAGDNLITWTNYKGYNPDIGRGLGERGIDFRQYPLNQSYHIGFQMNF